MAATPLPMRQGSLPVQMMPLQPLSKQETPKGGPGDGTELPQGQATRQMTPQRGQGGPRGEEV